MDTLSAGNPLILQNTPSQIINRMNFMTCSITNRNRLWNRLADQEVEQGRTAAYTLLGFL